MNRCLFKRPPVFKLFFFLQFLEDISPFIETTDTLFWTSATDFSQGGLFACVLLVPQIHLWCETFTMFSGAKFSVWGEV